MSIFTRISDMVSANVNALFDKWEDPVKMSDEYIRKIAKEIGDVRASTAEMEAQRKAAERAVTEKKKEIADWHAKATAAVKAGNNDHARVFLQKKNDLIAELPALEEREKVATVNAVEIRKSHDKLVNDMRTLQNRKKDIAADTAIAKAQEKAAGLGKSAKKAENAMAAFDRLEVKAKNRRDVASSMVELTQTPECDATALAKLYANGGGYAIESELEALMAENGISVKSEESIDVEINAIINEVNNGNA